MKIIIFGATGMVGQGVLRECLVDSAVTNVLAVGRSPTGQTHSKLSECLHARMDDVSSLASTFADYDAAFFCLGVTSLGMSEEQYTKLTYDLTLSVARTLSAANPQMSFVYVSGAGADSSEKGRVMWARVRGKTENDLLKLSFKHKHVFRPSYIQPMNGETSKVDWYKYVYVVAKPFYELFKDIFPSQVTSTEKVGRAMLRVAREGADKQVLESADINRLGTLA